MYYIDKTTYDCRGERTTTVLTAGIVVTFG